MTEWFLNCSRQRSASRNETLSREQPQPTVLRQGLVGSFKAGTEPWMGWVQTALVSLWDSGAPVGSGALGTHGSVWKNSLRQLPYCGIPKRTHFDPHPTVL